MKTKTPFLILLFYSLALTGCGYTVSGSTLPKSLKTVYVKEFVNKIDFATETRRRLYLPLLERDVRSAVVDRYLFDGNLRIGAEESADLILSGELLEYDRDALRYTDNDEVQEYRVQVIVSIKLFNTQTKEYMWEESSFAGEADYFVSGTSAGTEEATVKEAINDLARRIVERTIEDW